MEHAIGVGATILLVGYFGLNTFVALLVWGGEGLIRAFDGDDASPGERAVLYASILSFGVIWGLELVACLVTVYADLSDRASQIAIQIICAVWIAGLASNIALAAAYWQRVPFRPIFLPVLVVALALWFGLELAAKHIDGRRVQVT